jgi:hypothetical protein
MAIRTMAAAGELPKDARNAIEAIVDFESLIDLCEDRARLWKLAREATKIVRENTTRRLTPAGFR